MEALAGFSVIISLFVLALAVLWTCLPFALFGIKPRLDRIAGEQRANADLLRQLIGEMQAARGYQRPPTPVLAPPPPTTAPTPPVPTVPTPTAGPATPYDERAEKIARARALAAKVKPSAPGESRME
jgi:hypothetical protein